MCFLLLSCHDSAGKEERFPPGLHHVLPGSAGRAPLPVGTELQALVCSPRLQGTQAPGRGPSFASGGRDSKGRLPLAQAVPS